MPRVTINHKKVIRMNSKAYETLGVPVAVELSYDEEGNSIGMRPVDPKKDHAFPIKTHYKYRSGERSSISYRMINAAAFCKHFDIKPTGTMLFNSVEVERDGTMILELNNISQVEKGPR